MVLSGAGLISEATSKMGKKVNEKDLPDVWI